MDILLALLQLAAYSIIGLIVSLIMLWLGALGWGIVFGGPVWIIDRWLEVYNRRRKGEGR